MWPFNKRYVASQDEQLRVQYRDGRVEHVAGPRQLFFSRWKHEQVAVSPIDRKVASAEEVVVIKYLDGRLERRTGPCSVTMDAIVHKDIRVVLLERHVADPNEYLLILFRDGRKEMREGPNEICFDPFTHEKISVHRLQRSIADPGQYLRVQYLDGRVEHVPGPTELSLSPFVHDKIETQDAVRLAANEAVVVYRGAAQHTGAAATVVKGTPAGKDVVTKAHVNGTGLASSSGIVVPGAAAEPAPGAQEGATDVERRVVRGPAVFMLDSSEWLHEFSWHGSIKNGKGSKTGSPGDTKIPHALNFNVLRCMPDQIYYTVRDVRTSDDAHLSVHLMIFYELRAIEQMLDNTNDLIGDILSASSADTTTFASGLTYEAFLQDTAQLSKKETFPILSSRMEQIGTTLLKVVYRGYTTSPQLQKMHDEAIARRTKLRLESDAAREEQANLSMELRCRQERADRQQELEERDAKHKLQMKTFVLEQAREQAAADHADEMRRTAERHEAELRNAREIAKIETEAQRDRNSEELRKLEGMRELGVDLTQYLCALAALKPDQHLRIDSAADGADGSTPLPPNVHVELSRPKKRR